MNQKKFFRLYLPGVRDLYTWHWQTAAAVLEDPATFSLLGALVQIQFRNQNKIGLVVDEVTAPADFETQPILRVLEQKFFPMAYFDLAKSIANENFCPITKVIAGMIPKEFFVPKTEVKRQLSYHLQSDHPELNSGSFDGPIDLDKFYETHQIRGTKQRAALQYIVENKGVIDEKLLRQNFSLQVIRALLDKKIITQQTGHIIPELSLYDKTPPLPKQANMPAAAAIQSKNCQPGLASGSVPNNNHGSSQSIPPQFYPLTPQQQIALDQIMNSDQPTLLWGITGSGKTEVYKQVIQKIIFSKKKRANDASLAIPQALFLLPEIALTPQLINGFTHSFGAQNIAIWHSKLSSQQKVQAWKRVTTGDAKILIGTRSAALIPLLNPTVIIMDEEHEWTYKNEFAPRFWTHDVVQKIRQNNRATKPSIAHKLILGSATPRLESFYKVTQKKWQLATLSERVMKTPMPNFSVIDLRQEIKKNNPSPISERLHQKITDALKRKKQVVLFLNKRGYSASTMCQFCSHTFECPDCDSKMKAHKKIVQPKKISPTTETNLFSVMAPKAAADRQQTDQNISRLMHKLVCHVCGHLEWFPECCPRCHKRDFAFKGWGTQQVEIELKKMFATARIVRADADTVTKKSDWNRIHELFKNQEADILLGTQMISKGLDFDEVELVGIILADVGLNLPDFRAEERVFQLVTQVAGRAGRRKKQGHIVLQTFQPEAKVFDYVLRYDTTGFVAWQQQERNNNCLPPFWNMTKLTISHEDKTIAFTEAKKIEKELQARLETIKKTKNNPPDIQLSLAPAFFPRTHNKYHFHIYVQTPDKKFLPELLTPIMQYKHVKIDVNPSSIL